MSERNRIPNTSTEIRSAGLTRPKYD